MADLSPEERLRTYPGSRPRLEARREREASGAGFFKIFGYILLGLCGLFMLLMMIGSMSIR